MSVKEYETKVDLTGLMLTDDCNVKVSIWQYSQKHFKLYEWFNFLSTCIGNDIVGSNKDFIIKACTKTSDQEINILTKGAEIIKGLSFFVPQPEPIRITITKVGQNLGKSWIFYPITIN